MLYWAETRLAYFDCRSGDRRSLEFEILTVLHQLEGWVTAREFAKRHPELGGIEPVRGLLNALVEARLAETESNSSDDWPWKEWMPEAAFFHFGTRGGRYPADPLARETVLREKAKTHPPPSPVKIIDGLKVTLPPAADTGDLGAALLARRTWRNFGDGPVTLVALSTILKLTWGVRARGRVEGQGDVIFKTSPSGGSRHPIEVYVIATRISGLDAGIYHYQCASHELVLVGDAVSEDEIVSLLGHQYYFAPCAALFVMTARFERTMWRYPIKRAYRAVLAEAGHLGQTCCLVATHLGVGPFTTMAFDDAAIERLLDVRDETESALYVVGIGAQNPAFRDHPGRILPRRSV